MIRREGIYFKDEFNRTLLLRGVNLGGSSKVPFRPNGATHLREGFFEHADVSFVGRPFPLGEADEHFSRLRAWGFNFLRFLVTWEAIEHTGPGIYDEEFLDYMRAVVKKAADHGLSLFIDPHQDVWSRFSGGDGAPGWTLEAAGFDLAHFNEIGAAIVHQTYPGPFPKMIWSTNATKLAAATMFTLFFGGNDFAPLTRVNGEPVQDFLQRHYIESIRQLALRLNDLPNVTGYDSLNEPLTGFIGWQDLNAMGGELSLGDSPTPFQSMLLGEGIPQDVQLWKVGPLGLAKDGTRRLNPGRLRAWREGCACPWRQNGVWDLDSSGAPRLLKPDHFSRVGERKVDFTQDYLKPFVYRYADAIRSADPRALIFVEGEAAAQVPAWGAGDTSYMVYTPHWYDGYTLLKKEYSPFLAVDAFTHKVIFTPWAIRRSFQRQLGLLRHAGDVAMGGMPTLVGEIGIPFDLDGGKSFRSGDFSQQVKALDRSLQAVDANLLHYTLWDYTSDNSNSHGDQWNGEDFSIFSPDQQKNRADIHSGGRALEAAVRPYPRATAGEPLRLSFDVQAHRFEFTFRHDPRVVAPTEIFIPALHYPQAIHVEVSDGSYKINRSLQILTYQHTLERAEHTLKITP